MPTFFFTTKDECTRLTPVIRFAMTHKLPATEQPKDTKLARELAKPCWWHAQLAAIVSMQKKNTECTELARVLAKTKLVT